MTDKPSYRFYSYQVPVFDESKRLIDAFLGPATQNDLATNWECDWETIWDRSDFACQTIIKLTVNEDLWGLVRYGLYPYPVRKPDLHPRFAILENLETHPSRKKERNPFRKPPPPAPSPYIHPVGKWLIWHACQTALEHCIPADNPMLVLSATAEAMTYYRDVIGMQMTDVGPSSFGEDSYAFSFDGSAAQNFCDLQRVKFGDPQRIIEF